MDDLAIVRAERDALAQRVVELERQANPETRIWTSTEIGNLTHAEYLAVEPELHKALREGRVVRDDLPAQPDLTAQTAAVDAFLAAHPIDR